MASDGIRLSQRAQRTAPSPTLAITARANQMKAEGIDLVGFGAGEPDFDTPENAKEAAIEALRGGFTKYTPSSGIPALREAICAKLARDNGLEYRPNEIIVSCGAKHSIYNVCQALLDPGDEVIVFAPYWVSYPEQVKLADGVPVIVETDEADGFQPRPEAVAAAVTPRTKLLILNSPSNPTGGVCDRATIEAIAGLALRHGFLVLSDEIYEKVLYDGREHLSIASLSAEMKRRTITVNGFSKAYSMTGWRLGYAAAEAGLVAAMGRIQDQSTSNPTSFAQKGAVAALTGPQDAVEAMRRQFERRRDRIVALLNELPGVRCFNPGGAFYAFPNVAGLLGRRFGGRTISDGDALTELLLTEARVAVVPGGGFGAPDYLRLSYAISMEQIEKGLARIAAFAAGLE